MRAIIREEWDGGSIGVDTRQPPAAVQPMVTLHCEERAMATAVLTLTAAEVDALIDALIEARAEILGTPS